MSTLLLGYWAGSILASALVVYVAYRVRGGIYPRFVGILLGLHTLIGSGLVGHVARLAELPFLLPLFLALHATVFIHFGLLARPRMRPLWYRVFISLPAQYFFASVFLSFPWSIVGAFGVPLHGVWIPWLLGAVGLFQSFTLHEEERDVVIDHASAGDVVARFRGPKLDATTAKRPLRIMQITDPHLGPFMSVARLRGICERVVAKDPDLVLLTGDFLTMESQGTDEHLTLALAPLKALEGRVFACRGNHDHEAPEYVARALASAGVTLLIDEATVVETPAGPVQIVGMDFHFRRRKDRMAWVVAQFPRVAGALRLVLLHDPGAFRDLGEGEGDLVLSGHTHGGQLGLVSLGLPYTAVSLLSKVPDHGLWARGKDRLYVHRGTGHYGFPLRLGVSAEESLLRVHLVR